MQHFIRKINSFNWICQLRTNIFIPSSDDIISRRCLCQSTLLGFVTPTLTATTLECLLLYAVLPCTKAYALYVCVKPQNKGLNILGANKTYSRGRSRKLWFYNYELALTNNNINKMAKFSEARRNALVWLQLLYSSVNNPQNQCEEATKKRCKDKDLQSSLFKGDIPGDVEWLFIIAKKPWASRIISSRNVLIPTSQTGIGSWASQQPSWFYYAEQFVLNRFLGVRDTDFSVFRDTENFGVSWYREFRCWDWLVRLPSPVIHVANLTVVDPAFSYPMTPAVTD